MSGQLQTDMYGQGPMSRIQRREQPYKAGWLRGFQTPAASTVNAVGRARGHDESLAGQVTRSLDA